MSPSRGCFGASLLAFLLLLALPVSAQVQLTEFMANNTCTIKDDYGQYEDWIEIYNSSRTNVNLLDWALTDKADNLTKWRFPSTNLPPKNYLLVFASNRDRRTPGAPLHTNFKLDPTGEYLALVRPDHTVATEFSSSFPPQMADVSYGFAAEVASWKLLSTGSIGRVQVPLSSALGTSWASNEFNDAGWTRATNGIGYETGQCEAGSSLVSQVLGDNPAGYWRLGEMPGAVIANYGWLGATANGQAVGVTNGVPGPCPPGFPGFEIGNLAVWLTSGAKVQVPYSDALNPSGPFTLEAWVKPAQRGGPVGAPVISMNISSGRSGYAFYQDYDAKGKWEFILGNNNGYIARAIGGSVDTNSWQYLAGVYDGSSALLYVNGAFAGSSTLSAPFAPNTSVDFVLGRRLNVNPYCYTGQVDEVSIINRALTSPEIASRWQAATNPTAGTNYSYTGLIRTDLRTAMYSVNSSAFLRLPFTISNATDADQLTLRVKYDDGFAAWLNGVPAVAVNSPPTPVWNSTATAQHATIDALQFVEFDLSPLCGSLREGSNVLALQALNLAATNTDLLLFAELEASLNTRYSAPARYFVEPTPGDVNGTGSSDLGPILTSAGHTPAVPGTNDNITVTCRVTPTFAPVSDVSLYWRVMYGPTNRITMLDDGLHGDGQAGDGIYGAVISNRLNGSPTYTAGRMVRWLITAQDALSHTSRWPLFENPIKSAEYLGTVVQPDFVTSKLPILHLFVSNYTAGVGVDNGNEVNGVKPGGRASAFYDGEFYDNIFMCVRGNTTAGYFKKSHRLEFNKEHPLRHPGPGEYVRKTSFCADYPDPAYMRQGLAFWLCNVFGAPTSFYYPMRLQMNGEFYQLANHNDLQGEGLLDRLGYDPDGALYNAAGTIQPGGFSTGGFDKKTRNWESNADYTALANAISENLSENQRCINVFDLLDLPEVISYLVVARFVHENDDVWANMSVYHDNDGDGLWRIIGFDMNLSFGAAFLDSSEYSGIQVTNDNLKSFPLYGTSKALPSSGGSRWNRLYDVIFSVPQTREMFLRRMRTFLDTYVKPPGTPPDLLPIERHVLQWRNLIAEEAARDRVKWGWPGKGGQCNFDPGIELTNGVNILINDFLEKRREHFYGKHSVTNTALPIGISKTDNAGIPLAQPRNAVVSVVGWDYNPVSGNQDEEFVCITNANNYAVDISGWKLDGGISHRFQPGTVIPSFSALYLSPNIVAFRSRATAPHGGMGLFVQGNYKGHLNAWGETLRITDDTGRLVSSNRFVGAPSLAQQYLRITEIMYNPPPDPGGIDAQDFEYIELKNISPVLTLDLSDVRFTNGIYFNFTGSAVTTLGPHQSVLVVRNLSAFTARYGSGYRIAGQYSGALDNAGETIRLEDRSGEKILEFAYNNSWYRSTDGLGFSLVIVDETADWKTWGDRASWRPSGVMLGSPGTIDPAPPAIPPVLINEALTHSDSNSDWIELYNPTPTNVDVGGWFVTDDPDSPRKYQIPVGTVIQGNGFLVLWGTNTFESGPNAFRLFSFPPISPAISPATGMAWILAPRPTKSASGATSTAKRRSDLFSKAAARPAR